MDSSRRQPLLIGAAMVLPLVAMVPQSAWAGSPATPAASTASPKCGPIAPFSAKQFPDRPKIDNRWLPLVPGANTVLRGSVQGDDGTLHQHSIVATVTDLTKT